MRQLQEQGCVIDDEDDALMPDIREKAEKTKLQLSNVETARPIFTINGSTYRIEITRESFEKEVEALMQRTQLLLEDVLEEKISVGQTLTIFLWSGVLHGCLW